MPNVKLQAQTLSGTADEVESQFYEAMQAGDLDRLMACWSEDDDVLCVHPGGARLTGSAAIRSVFEAMFANGNVQVIPERLRKIETLSSAVHNLVERVEIMAAEGPIQVVLIATNVYHKTPHGWRLVVHHVSQGSEQSMEDIDHTSKVLH